MWQNYKIKYVDNLFIYYCKELLKTFAEKLLPIWNLFFIRISGIQKGLYIYLTLTSCDSWNSTSFHFMEFICWCWFNLSFGWLCRSISYEIKIKRILSYCWFRMCSLMIIVKMLLVKKRSIVFTNLLEVFAKIWYYL